MDDINELQVFIITIGDGRDYMEIKYCKGCGKELSIVDEVCPNCGYRAKITKSTLFRVLKRIILCVIILALIFVGIGGILFG